MHMRFEYSDALPVNRTTTLTTVDVERRWAASATATTSPDFGNRSAGVPRVPLRTLATSQERRRDKLSTVGSI